MTKKKEIPDVRIKKHIWYNREEGLIYIPLLIMSELNLCQSYQYVRCSSEKNFRVFCFNAMNLSEWIDIEMVSLVFVTTDFSSNLHFLFAILWNTYVNLCSILCHIKNTYLSDRMQKVGE